MDNRAMFVLALYVIAVGYALRGPFPALLVYLWLGYFRPDHWVGWSLFIRKIPMSFWVAVYLLASMIMSPAVKMVPRGRAWLVLVFALHMGISLALSPYATAETWFYYRVWAQSMVITVVLTLLITDRVRLRTVLIVMALSISIDGAKQGWAGLIGQSSEANINDIPFLGDNNQVAVGVLMMAGLLGGLVSSTRRRAGQWFLIVLLLGMLLRALQTHSRGGFLAIIGLALAGLIFSRRRLSYLVFGSVTALALVSVMPANFWGRMGTITPNVVGALEKDTLDDDDSKSLDTSAQSRVHFWSVAQKMAADHPVLGLGYQSYMAAYDDYDPTDGWYGHRRAVHSAWFGALAEGGYVGLLLFLMNLVPSVISCWQVYRLAKRHPELSELGSYAAGLIAALLAYIIGATFVTMQYTEILWHFMALSIVLWRIAHAEAALLVAPSEAPAQPFGATAVLMPAPASRTGASFGARQAAERRLA